MLEYGWLERDDWWPHGWKALYRSLILSSSGCFVGHIKTAHSPHAHQRSEPCQSLKHQNNSFLFHCPWTKLLPITRNHSPQQGVVYYEAYCKKKSENFRSQLFFFSGKVHGFVHRIPGSCQTLIPAWISFVRINWGTPQGSRTKILCCRYDTGKDDLFHNGSFFDKIFQCRSVATVPDGQSPHAAQSVRDLFRPWWAKRRLGHRFPYPCKWKRCNRGWYIPHRSPQHK